VDKNWFCVLSAANIDNLTLAAAIKASREAISKYERNEAVPSVEVVSKIAEVFAVTIDYLIGKDHNMAVDKKP
jgi:transcriptional regulator with XRE-family HTH domain